MPVLPLTLAAGLLSPETSVRLQAVAVAQIVPGERIRLGAEVQPPAARTTRVVRRDASGRLLADLRLIEFQ